MTTLSIGNKQTIEEWLNSPIQDPLRDINQALSDYHEALPEDLHERAKRLLDQAEYFLAKTDHPHLHSPSFIREVFELFISFIEMIFDVFGAHKLFGSTEYEWQEEQKTYKLMNLVSSVGMISTQILPLLGIEEAQKKVAVVLTAIMGFSLIYPKIQPTPRSLPRARNLTKEIQKGEVEVLEGQRRVLDRMAAAMKNHKKVMLVGPSGVGKTETAKAFIEAVIRGDYPELQGKFAFYYNTADIVDHFGNNMIGRIMNVAGKNLRNMIFVWDEFHVAAKGQLADQMKTLFDSGPKSLPYAIVITTDAEAKEFERTNHGALVRRFEQIPLARPSDEEVSQMLPTLLLRKMPEAVVINPKETFAYLVAQCREKLPTDQFTPYQVHNALEVLKLCFAFIGESQYTPPEEGHLRRKQEEEATLGFYSIGSFGEKAMGAGEVPKKEVVAPQKDDDEERKAFFVRRKQLFAMKRAYCDTTLSLAKAEAPSTHDLKKFHLIEQVLPLMERELIERAGKLGLKTVITQELIDQAIADILMRRSQKVDAKD